MKNFQFSIFNFQKSLRGFTQHQSHAQCLGEVPALSLPTKWSLGAGFTLIEAMVAVTILTIAIAGPLTTANRAIVASQIARDQLTASYLAQEIVEYVRAARDDAYLAAYAAGGSDVTSRAWTEFMNRCSSAPCVPDYIAPAQNFSEFTRSSTVTAVTGTEAKVTARVGWSYHGVPYSVTITDHLTSWQ